MLKKLINGCKDMSEKYKNSILAQKEDIKTLEQSIERKKEGLCNFIDNELYDNEQKIGKVQLEYDIAIAKLSEELNSNMKILNGITQCRSVFYKDARCYMLSKNMAGHNFLIATFQSKHILRGSIHVGNSWSEELFDIWHPLGFDRSILYG